MTIFFITATRMFFKWMQQWLFHISHIVLYSFSQVCAVPCSVGEWKQWHYMQLLATTKVSGAYIAWQSLLSRGSRNPNFISDYFGSCLFYKIYFIFPNINFWYPHKYLFCLHKVFFLYHLLLLKLIQRIYII